MINPWEPPARLEEGYKTLIRRALAGLQTILFSAGTLPWMLAEMERYAQSEEFRAAAWAAAAKMVTNTLSWSSRTWRDAARVGSKGQEIYNLLYRDVNGRLAQEMEWQIVRNAQLISSLPQNIREQVDRQIVKMTTQGMRPEQIASLIREQFPNETAKRAALVARTEAAKTQTAITRAKAESVGVEWYVWHATRDQRTRDSHRNMDGVLCRWDTPPSPERLNGERSAGNYGPGEIWNCRCYPEPVTKPERLSWPRKVYYGGRIQRMTLAQFESIGGTAA